MKKTLNLAHRGFSGKYPENTMLAFIKAVEAGCDGIETDIQLTKDGVPVIIHDETLHRTTSGSGYVKDFTLQELKQLDAGGKYDGKFQGEKIPSLDEFLDYVKNKDLYINLELKNSIVLYPNIEEIVIKKVKEYKLEDNVILSSFNHYSMVKVKEICKNIKTGLLISDGLYKPEEYVKYVGADALHPHYFLVLNKDVTEGLKNSNIEINTYTVNDENSMKQLISYGINSIITNHPDLLNSIINNKY